MGTRNQDRIEFVDVTRGLLIYWMVVAHTLTLSGIAGNSMLNYLRPPGWATHGFVMLSGLSLAVAFLGRELAGVTLRLRIGKRALQLLAWAVATELVSRLLRDLFVEPTGQPLLDLVSVKRTWTISAFLIPPSIVFGIAALVSPYLKCPSHRQISAFSLAAAVVVGDDFLSSGKGLSQISSVLGIPLVLFLCLASFGVGIGLLCRRIDKERLLYGLSILGVSILILHHSVLHLPRAIYIVGTFFVTLVCGLIIDRVQPFSLLKGALALMGRSALLLFISHRLILQFGAGLARESFGGTFLFVALLSSCLIILVSFCYLREKSPRLSTSLKTVGL